MPFTRNPDGVSAPDSSLSNCACPRITPSILLKSCAIPPASSAMDSIFWACRNLFSESCSALCAFFNSVKSRAMVDRNSTSPLSFLCARITCRTGITRPSRDRNVFPLDQIENVRRMKVRNLSSDHIFAWTDAQQLSPRIIQILNPSAGVADGHQIRSLLQHRGQALLFEV